MNKALAFLLVLGLTAATTQGRTILSSRSAALAGSAVSKPAMRVGGVGIVLANGSTLFQAPSDEPNGQVSVQLPTDVKVRPTPVVPVPSAVQSGLGTLGLLALVALGRKVRGLLRE